MRTTRWRPDTGAGLLVTGPRPAPIDPGDAMDRIGSRPRVPLTSSHTSVGLPAQNQMSTTGQHRRYLLVVIEYHGMRLFHSVILNQQTPTP